MLSKKTSRIVQTMIWLLIAIVYIGLRFSTQYLNSYYFRTAQYDPKIRAEQTFGYLTHYISAQGNPISGPITRSFLDISKICEQDGVPQLPEPYSQFTFLIRGYKIGERFTYISPWLSEERLPKELIERTTKKFPNFSENNPDYSIWLKRKIKNDTLFFRAELTDKKLRAKAFTQLLELAVRYSPYESTFYDPLTTENHLYLETVCDGKVVFHTEIDSAKKFQVFDSDKEEWTRNFGYRIRIYSQFAPSRLNFEYTTDRFWKSEWKFFLLYTLALVMLLRGDSVREIVVGWWNRKRG